MNKKIYRQLAYTNIKKNRSTFFPFMLSAVTMTALYYMLSSITGQIENGSFLGSRTMKDILQFGVLICGILSAGILFYTNSFLLKRRTKELGLYHVLGLEKKHISCVLFWEIFTVGIAGIGLGLALGILFARLMFLVLLNLVGLPVEMRFTVSIPSIWGTFRLFLIVYVAIIGYNHIKLYFLKPMEMMRQASVGEREPRTKLLSAVIGTICLATGYYMAVTVKNPLESISRFFIAVLFVIAGTYLLFMTGSVAFLKLIRKSKGYYYHKTHFITVSSMIYRMRQNAVGLANICIFSTAVLIILSSTISLYLGVDDVVKNRFPQDITTNYLMEDGWENREEQEKLVEQAIEGLKKKAGVKAENTECYYEFGMNCSWENGDIVFNKRQDMESNVYVVFQTLEDYRRNYGSDVELKEGHVFAFSSEGLDFTQKGITVFGEHFKVQKLKDKNLEKKARSQQLEVLLIILPDFESLQRNMHIFEQNQDTLYLYLRYNYNFDLNGDEEKKIAFSNDLRDTLNNAGVEHVAAVESIYTSKQDILESYAGLFFIGIFIGTLFLTATVLIIYYKQISEGYEDQKRFAIMQKVGMDRKEVKHIINSQIRMVFYLPIAAAVIHILFAFRIIQDLLKMFNLTNIQLFIACTAGTIVVFAIFYTAIYYLTAGAYYRLVENKD